MKKGLLRQLGARLDATLDAWSAKSRLLNVVLSAGRSVAVGVKLLARDTRQVLRDRDAPETYRTAERKSRVKRELLIGLPLAVFFNIPIREEGVCLVCDAC